MSKEEQFRWPSALQVMNGALGLLSIVGGILALRIAWEPARYGVSGVIMICSGIAWLICSMVLQFRLTRRQYLLLVAASCLGMAFGLLCTFNFCGGELSCFSYHGYPGRWLRVAQNMYTMDITWRIDYTSFVASVIFWCGGGMLLSFIWKTITLLKGRRQITAG